MFHSIGSIGSLSEPSHRLVQSPDCANNRPRSGAFSTHPTKRRNRTIPARGRHRDELSLHAADPIRSGPDQRPARLPVSYPGLKP